MQIKPISPIRYYRAITRRLKAAVPSPATTAVPPPVPDGPTGGYADLYERHAVALTPTTSIGSGDFDVIGSIELAILVEAGLRPSSTLLDFGCGTGRLAVHAVPYLTDGRYIGTDIAPTMLVHARDLLAGRLGTVPSNVDLRVQPDEAFPVDGPVDVICAYSVFTHMEHEDTYRYLRSAHAISTASTAFVASLLEIDNVDGRHFFLESAGQTMTDRWAKVRNVVTSRDMFTEVARLAGWAVERWSPGSGPACTMPDGSPAGIGQSVVVLRPLSG